MVRHPGYEIGQRKKKFSSQNPGSVMYSNFTWAPFVAFGSFNQTIHSGLRFFTMLFYYHKQKPGIELYKCNKYTNIDIDNDK